MSNPYTVRRAVLIGHPLYQHCRSVRLPPAAVEALARWAKKGKMEPFTFDLEI